MPEISLYSYPYLKLEKMLCLLIIAYVFFSTKLEKRVRGVRGRGSRKVAGGRDGPVNVCTYE
jgi:hypothetical protein